MQRKVFSALDNASKAGMNFNRTITALYNVLLLNPSAFSIRRLIESSSSRNIRMLDAIVTG